MECLWLIFGVVVVILLTIIASQLTTIKRKVNIIIMNQEEFDAQIARAVQELTDIATAIQAETAQITAYIESLPPEVDTSALAGVVDNLQTVSESIAGVFTPPDEG